MNLSGIMQGAGLGSSFGVPGAIAGGVLGAFGVFDPAVDPASYMNAVDPFAPYRANYAQELNRLMAHPESVQGQAGFAAELQMGQQATERALAAQGKTQSGAEQIALQNLGMTQQNRYFKEQYDRLAQLSGAGVSPAYGGQAYMTGAAELNAQKHSGIVGGLALASNKNVQDWLGNLFSSHSGTATPTSGTSPSISSTILGQPTNYSPAPAIRWN